MTVSWDNLLTQQTTVQLDQNQTSSIIPLSSQSVLQVSGDDSQSFLQNLVTNDINALAVNQGQLAGFCNAKGRLFAIFVVIRTETGYLLILPSEMADTLQQRLSMYVLRSKVVITKRDDELKLLGLISRDANNIDAPSQNYQATEFNDGLIIRLPDQQQRLLFIGSQQQSEQLAQQLIEQQWQLAAQSHWQQYEINAGIPTVVVTSKEKFTPQQVNLDLVNGVSFHKGCYPGQEVVARLHYLGKPSRRMFIATISSQAKVECGEDVLTDNGDIAGQIVNVAQTATGFILLASLKLAERQAVLCLKDKTPLTLINGDTIE